MITLQEITPDNHAIARKMAVHPEQERLVASIDKTLADAFVWKEAIFRVATDGQTPIGYVFVFPFDDDGKHIVNIVRMMIDAERQGKGWGRQLLDETIKWVSTFTPKPDLLRISTLPDNEVALALYKSSEFIEQGIEEGEIALFRELNS